MGGFLNSYKTQAQAKYAVEYYEKYGFFVVRIGKDVYVSTYESLN